MRLSLRFFLLVFLILLTAGPHVLAENEDNSRYPVTNSGGRSPLDWIFRGQKSRDAGAAVGVRTQRSYEPRRRSSTRTPAVSPQRPADMADMIGPPAPAPAGESAIQPSVKVNLLVVGDSLAGLLAQGIQEIYADRPYVNVLKKSRDSSGLVRDDFYDWPKSLREMLASGELPDAVVIMIGTNDRQTMKDETGTLEPRSERWRALYEARMSVLIAAAREKNVPVIWVGLPVMKLERYSGDILAFNEIYRVKVPQAGATYVDIWEAFTSSEGGFSVSGPDVTGETVRLRTSDGVHFTQAGARKLAFFVDKELQKVVAAKLSSAPLPRPDTPPAVLPPFEATPMVLGAPPVNEMPLPPQLRPIDSLIGIPLPDRPLLSPLMPRPASGPVQMLTAVPVSPNGVLIDARGAGREETEASQRLSSGLPMNPRPGRVDDFTFKQTGR